MIETIFSANNRAEVVVLPYTPDGLEVESRQDNSVFKGLSRGRQSIGTMQPRTLDFSGRFFKRRPAWAHAQSLADPMGYVEFFTRWREALVPIRLIVTDGTREVLNMAVTVDEFSWGLTKTGDITYSLTLSEYVFVR